MPVTLAKMAEFVIPRDRDTPVPVLRNIPAITVNVSYNYIISSSNNKLSTIRKHLRVGVLPRRILSIFTQILLETDMQKFYSDMRHLNKEMTFIFCIRNM